MAFQDPATLGRRQQKQSVPELPWGGIWLADHSGRLVDASAWFLDLLGLEAEEASGFGWMKRIARDDPQAAERCYAKLRSDVDWEDEVHIHDSTGRSHTLLTRAHLVRAESDALEHWIGIHLDISRRADAQRLQISRAKRQGRDSEREAIARAIHNDIQQLLYAAKTHIARLRRIDSIEQVAAASDSIQALIDESLRVSRGLTRDLGPARKAGVAPSLDGLAEWMADTHDLRVELHVGDVEEVSPEMQDLLFDACRELLFNVVKHAQVAEARVEIGVREGRLRLEVEDHGRGFRPEHVEAGPRRESTGFGLDDIRARVLAVGGALDIDSASGRGTLVRVSIPYPG